ncbi:MAG TPA: Stp1/IreP family PP2C-type Ser/Thr phosphatase [Nitrospirota bacterium]|nr:Stp1/IreP family PP2C-type Ser/Thr phosphatase [Nitrospirota bacterium]
MKQDLKSCLKKIFFSAGEQHTTQSSFVTHNNGDTRVLQPAYTVRLKPEPNEELPASAPQGGAGTAQRSTAEMSLVWCGLTDTGLIRDHNEDFFSCKALEESSLFIVADGMGGHDAGEVASRLAVETVCKEVQESAKGVYDPEKLLERAVQHANAEVIREGVNKGYIMGTTLTLALMARERAYIASVGDSRTYWIENGSIRQITEDHSLVAKLVSAGKLMKEESRTHPKANLLYRTIGTDENVKVDTFKVDLKRGDSLLLCTDGLWGEVTDEDIHRVCSTEEDLTTACTKLIQAANDNGGKDNITAVVVKLV